MTALARYARLETLGQWRPDPASLAQEVVVSFGDATLVLSDGDGRPLAHWSLPAVTRLNPERTPARFAPTRTAPKPSRSRTPRSWPPSRR
jgi:hypothetical protein